jgi:hypothetical protein
MKRINTLELILGIIFVITMLGAIGFGQDRATYNSSGMSGGAIAFGIISATALIGIVWIEVVRLNRNK